MSALNLASFRDGGDGCSEAVYSLSTYKWLCGGSLGQAFEMPNSSEEFSTLQFNSDDSAVTALAISDAGSILAHAAGDSVVIRSLADLESIKESLVCRRSLPITHLQFSTNGDMLLVSSQEPGLQFYSVSQGTVVDTVSTFDSGVRTFALSSDGLHLAILDCNATLTVYRLRSNTDMLADSARPFLSKDVVSQHVNFVPISLARDTTSMGCSMIWFNSPGHAQPTLLCPSSSCVAVLTPDGSDRWAESYILPEKAATGVFNVLSVSPNAHFLAAAHDSGGIVVWRLDSSALSESREICTASIAPAGPLFSLHWGLGTADNYLLALSDSSWCKWNNVVTNGHPVATAAAAPVVAATASAASNAADVAETEEEAALLRAVEAAEAQAMTMTQAVEEEMSSPSRPTDGAATSAEPHAAPVRKRLHKTAALSELAPISAVNVDDDIFVEPEVTVKSSEEKGKDKDSAKSKANSKPVSKAAVQALFNDEADDDGDLDNEDDLDQLMDEQDAAAADAEVGVGVTAAEVLRIATSLEAKRAARFQPAFQPSSTRPDEKNRRYLVWNHVGNITVREEALESRVEVRFANTANGNRNEAFPDRTGYVMAALAYEGAVFATEAEVAEEEKEFDVALPSKKGRGSIVHYRAFPGKAHLQGANESFSWTLPPNEAALAVACGKGWVAVATSKQLLRIFSATGSELSLSWLPGPVVAMTGCEEKLAVVYHTGRVVNDAAVLEMMLLELPWLSGCRCRTVVESLVVPLSVKSTLSWMGYDVDQGLVCVMDSEGMVSALLRGVGWQWMPVLDVHEVRKSLDHKYWPVTIRGDKLVYVLLNGESRPTVHPQPVVSVKPLRLSVCARLDGKDLNDAAREKHHRLLWEDAKASHLESLVQHAGLVGHMDLPKLEERLEAQTLEADKTVLKMLQEACQTQQIALALSLAIRLRTTKVIEAAITVANHFGRTQVAHALDQLLQHKVYMQQLAQAATTGAGAGFGGADVYDLPATQEGDYPGYENYGATEETGQGGGVLSRKASLKQQAYPPLTKAITAVSPATEQNDESVVEKSKEMVNPFAVTKTGSTPVKRKSVLEGVQELKASPSPKKPALSRLSTVSQTARTNRLSDQKML